MKMRTKIRAGGVVLTSLTSAACLQGLAAPVAAGSQVVHATVTTTLVAGALVELVPRENQCLLYVNQVVRVEGTLAGTVTSVRPAEIRFMAGCDEVFDEDHAAGIVRTFRSVGHYVGDDGKEATLRSVGSTDAAGEYDGIVAVHGDLSGILHETASDPPPGSPLISNLEGILIVKG